jgi:succinate dehydrogenase / fumarate reductase flavoprotein subunit
LSERCDVLVIGAGGTALRAAIAACEAAPQLRVTLVTKGRLGHAGVTATACSDRMAFHATLPDTAPGGPEAWRYHADDIYAIGGAVSDWDLAATLAQGSAAAFAYLDHLGVPWARRADGRPDQFVTDGSLYARACYTGPYTANHIEAALLERLGELPVRVIEGHLVAELLLDERRQRVVGAALVAEGDGRVTAIAAAAVILATGGAGQAFAVNVYPPDCTGDGYALAYRAGAELVSLEFIQIGLSSLQTKLACSGDMFRALPRLVDEADREFLPPYMAQYDAATRYDILFAKGASWPVSSREPSHIIDIAVAAELAAGHRVFLDYGRDPQGLNLSALSASVRAWYENTKGVTLSDAAQAGTPLARLRRINAPSIQWLAERGVALERGDRLEIAPAIQHFQGGVKIRPHAETTVAGLYAAGEVAGGQHGANRPGGNALMDCQVMGRIAGESAAREALRASDTPAPTDVRAKAAVRALFAASGIAAEQARAQVRAGLARYASVYRTAAGLRRLSDELEALAQQGLAATGASLAQAVEAVNILAVGHLVARAALARDESRGPHLRFPADGSLTPLPQGGAEWERYLVLRTAPDGSPAVELCDPRRP